MFLFFLKGMAIGFLLALPIGPTMVLCIRYSLAYGASVGLVTGAGAGLADAIYGVLAGYGLYAVVDFMETYKNFFHLFGGAILIYLGIKTLREHFRIQKATQMKKPPSLFRLFMMTFTLTVTSPLTFVGVSALCVSFGVGAVAATSLLSPWALGAGLMVGSCIWWQTLSSCLAFFRKKITSQSSTWIGKISGSILLLLGIALMTYSLVTW